MKVTRVDEGLSVASQPSLSDIAGLPGRGFSTLVNNRPDGEDLDQPAAEAERRAAAEAGLAHADLPVTGAGIGLAEIERFRDILAGSPGPVLAHCRSGTRSLTLHVLGRVLHGEMKREDVLAYGAGLGFDLTGALAWLNAHAAGPEGGE